MLQSILTIINPHDLTTKPYIYIIQDFFLLLMYDFEKKNLFFLFSLFILKCNNYIGHTVSRLLV